jgi:hypothetical protein
MGRRDTRKMCRLIDRRLWKAAAIHDQPGQATEKGQDLALFG